MSGLRRLLRSMTERLDMVFCDGGEKALAMLEEQSFDVVVSDMRMPGWTGRHC
ncbi:MAG: Uncharacterized protein FD149_1707 [Rhodospirillaceae bacterium]|nr:MAG: Uncharacterized protein FD149_1707 [Rhodospirillaceae bacterium]